MNNLKLVVDNVTPSFSGSLVMHNGELCMSSRDIAAFFGKEHKHVRRDIREMLNGEGIDESRNWRIYKDSMNRDQTEYMLNEVYSTALGMFYSLSLGVQIATEWKQLKEQQHKKTIALPSRAELAQWVVDAEQQIDSLKLESHQKSVCGLPMSSILATRSNKVANAAFTWAVNQKFLRQRWEGNKAIGYDILPAGEKYFIDTSGNARYGHVQVLPAFREVCPKQFFPGSK